MRKAIIAIAVLNALWGSLALITSEELQLDHHATGEHEAGATHAHHETSQDSNPSTDNCAIEHCPFCFISIVTGPLPEFTDVAGFNPVQAAHPGCSLIERQTPAFFAFTLGPRPPPTSFI